ncbi:MAG TPA: cation:proton antiporter, partial [Spirochaetia bacterium]
WSGRHPAEVNPTAVAHILSLVEFQMSALLFVALAGYLAASLVNQSVVIGEILVGLLMGPSVLGIITYTDFVGSIAHLGAIILLFVVGLEFRLEDIAKPWYLLIAACGVVVPWVMGYLVSLAFGFPFGSAVFIGTALTATSIAITANVLKEMGRLGSGPGRAIIGAAVIDDVLSLLALGVGNGLVTGDLSVGALAIVLAKALAFLGVGAALGHFGLRRLLIVIDGSRFTRRHPEVTFIFATMLAFLYAVGAELMGLSAIVGAFIAGASLAGVKLANGRDLYKGSESLMIIFSSVFFVSLGVLADVRTIDTRLLVFTLVLTVVAFVSKLIGCGGVALLRRRGPHDGPRDRLRDATVIGVGMAPRGEVAMIVALIGLDKGIIGQEVYVSIILMSLLTTIVAPILLKGLLARRTQT